MKANNTSALVFLLVIVFIGSSFTTFSVPGVKPNVAFATESVSKSAQKEIVMGIFPRRSPRKTLELFSPLANYLTEKLNHKVKIRTAKNFKEFWNNVKNGKYDLVHYNQYHYVKSNKEFGYKVILQNEEFGSSTLSGAIYVRKDSKINSLEDLKGKTIGFGGGKMAMVSYIAPTALLKRAGLNVGTDYYEQFSKNPPVTVLNTYHKKFDAGGAGDVVIKLNVVTTKIKTDEMKIIAKTEPMAHLPWAVKGNMDGQLVQQIQEHMLSLNKTSEGKKILGDAKLTGINIAKDEDYKLHRDLIHFVTGHQY